MQPGDIYSPPPGSQHHQQLSPRQHHHQRPPQGVDPFANPPPIMDNSRPYSPVGQGQPRPYSPAGQGHPGAPPGADWQQPSFPPGAPGAPLGHSESHSSFAQTPYGLHDAGMTSPPPLFPSQSISDLHATPGAPGFPQAHGYGHPLEDDVNDAQPLLNHAYPDQRFGAQPVPPQESLYDPPLHGGIPPSDGAGGRIRFDDPAGAGPGEPNNVHYGLPPTRQLRRNRTQKRVQLYRGHLVLDVDVPSMLLDGSPVKQGNEFTKMRYTAITCDPNDFVEDNYTLRQRLYKPERHTELFIVVTMYNEDDILFCRTMRGIMQNIAHLCSRSRSKTWGEDGWKKVVVCIVSDGRLKINARTRSVLAALGVYQDGVAKNVVNGKPVTAHLYEYTTQLWIDSKGKVGPGGNHAVPVQLMFCLKEKNQKKINSHRWFFNAFGECLRPNVCVLLDVGTQPGPDSIYHLWKAFDINSSVGGACGEIVALKGMFWKNLINPLVAAQNFEYKMSNILDKPLESAFGYITVLPGAFSAYRYIALQNDERGKGPLEKYFLGETLHGTNAGIFESNMYLAEDRILCWELVSKRASRWTLHYVKSAYAITDVPDTVAELVSQRRRWLNGSFFAAVHAIAHFGYLYRSSHSLMRKFALHIEFIYQIITNVFAWFALGNFYIAFVVLTKSLELSYEAKPGEPLYDEHGNRKVNQIFKWINIPLGYLYLALLLLCFLLSLGNRPAGSVVGYTISMIGFAIITMYMLFAAIWLTVKGVQALKPNGESVGDLIKNSTFRNIIMSLAATYGLYVVASIISLDPWHMFTSFFQYLLLAPSYINVLNVYAFSNVHDVSWGTKGSDKVNEDLGVVKSSGEKDEVTVDAYFEQKDINAVYQQELDILATKPPKAQKSVNAEQAQEDYYKNFRTNVLLAWTMTNAALAIVMIRVGTDGRFVIAETYMAVMLYTVAGLAFFRFLGACVYLLLRLFMGE